MSVVHLSSCPVAYEMLYSPGATLNGAAGEGWNAELGFRVGKADLFDFVSWAGGSPQTITVGGATVTRYVPLSHPDYPNLLCQGIKSTCTGSYSISLGNWSEAKVILNFKNVPYATDGAQPFLVKRTRASANVYTIAGLKLAFSDHTPLPADAGVTIPEICYTYMLYMCEALDDALVGSLLGKVNSTSIFGWPAGTVRSDGFNAEETFTAGQIPAYNRELVLTYRPIPWNKFLKPDGTWDYALKPGGGYVYDSADLNQLFQ